MPCHSREGDFWRGLFGCHFPRRGMQLNDGGSHRTCIPMLPACVPCNPLDCKTHDSIGVAIIRYLAPHFLKHRAPQPKTSSKTYTRHLFLQRKFLLVHPTGSYSRPTYNTQVMGVFVVLRYHFLTLRVRVSQSARCDRGPQARGLRK